MFDRTVFFAEVRQSLFGGALTQQQVDGMNFKLAAWEMRPQSDDLRHLAYPFATSMHETGSKMWPVAEIGKGAGKPYGKPDPRTGEIYYGRGDVQLTWYDNYARATTELELTGEDDLVQHPDRALHPPISAAIMYLGMEKGWFRKDSKGPQTLARYFNASKDDGYTAREIINGDKHIVPKWSGGVSIGKLVDGYHDKFFSALNKAWREPVVPEPEVPEEAEMETVVYRILVTKPKGTDVRIVIEEEGVPI